jgi:hypothetical protein
VRIWIDADAAGVLYLLEWLLDALLVTCPAGSRDTSSDWDDSRVI